jgi:hypothetical protein
MEWRAEVMPKTTKNAERIYMSYVELPLEARLRREHAGKWIAWAPDFKTLVAVGDDHAAAREAGVPRAVMEWVEPISARLIDDGA